MWRGGEWVAVARYDFAHGEPHLDVILRGGKKRKKWLIGKSAEEVVTEAIDDLKGNWGTYLKESGHENDEEE